MLRTLLSFFFAPRAPSELILQIRASHEAYLADLAADPPLPVPGHDWPSNLPKPYGGRAVPGAVLYEPNAEFLDDWCEEWIVAPASTGDGDGGEAVVFHESFEAERESGSVDYEEDARRDPRVPVQRLADTVAIHRLLEEGHADGDGGDQYCKRIVRFRGSTLSHYRIERPPGAIFSFTVPHKKDEVVLALYQRWALQFLSACRYIHAKGIVLNAPVDECTWLRSDFSLIVAGFTAASCQALDIPAGDWADSVTYLCPFGPADSRSTEPPFGVDECGEARSDLFNWACWVHGLMRGGKSPVEDVAGQRKYGSPLLDDDEEERARERAVREGRFEDWPVLREEEFGSCLVKAWKGEYESAGEALRDVRQVLEGCGKVSVEGEDGEIGGFDWGKEFEYDEKSRRILRSLKEKE